MKIIHRRKHCQTVFLARVYIGSQMPGSATLSAKPMQRGGECYHECSRETLLSLKISSVPVIAYHLIDNSVKSSVSEQESRVGNGQIPCTSPRKKVASMRLPLSFWKVFSNNAIETLHHYIHHRAWKVGWNHCSGNPFESLRRMCLLHPFSRDISDFPVSFSKNG